MRQALEVDDLDASVLAERRPNGLAQVRAGNGFAGMIIRNVFPEATMQEIVRRLEAGLSRIPRNESDYYPGVVFGRVLPAERDATLHAYFEEAAIYREESRRLFDGLQIDFLTRLERILSSMAGGREVRLARSEDGREYQAFSIRTMMPSGQIGLHYENEAFDAESMAGLRRICGAGVRPHLLSIYLTLQAPERGGELGLYSIGEDDPDTPTLKYMPRDDARTYEHFERTSPHHRLRAGTGDMLLFDAGRYFHRVVRVEGERDRWTIGSFIVLSEDDSTFCYFA
ncbi:2OG-Fe(II)-dependent halogenase WelO5 family protein [Paraliomyxa miuraensis]|uniref:2OG-Fe(II)-dependent halogenase WelO5 family protein n=1 Tax=Paraliomyxa miuraensis TaxID=376150 RepID=UPI002251F219|nr:hypothetical protein [Paraliomyxa miuraensis]MCX4243648.1 2OG-Fe(II) oxygenase [Paraliomyxa miuraensis]